MDADRRAYPYLFSELEVGTRTLRNRIALPATLTNFGLRIASPIGGSTSSPNALGAAADSS